MSGLTTVFRKEVRENVRDRRALFNSLLLGPLLFLSTPLGPLQLSFGFPIVRESYDEKELFRLSLGTRF